MMRQWLAAAFSLLCLLAGPSAHAGVLTRAELVRRFPAPLMVGERDAALPVWPLFKQNATSTELVGYVFESVDLAPIAGFSGVAPNLLVALDARGTFIDVALLSQHEPVFVDGLGEAPLQQFLHQYQGLSLKQNISIDTDGKGGKGRRLDAARVTIDGVSKATASVRIINQSVLSAALKVARKKLGFAQGRDPDQIARIRPDVVESPTLQAMLDEGMLVHLLLRNRDVERLFAGSPGAGLDPLALAAPDDVFIDLYLAYASVPAIGRTLLAEASWRKLVNRLEPGDHALLVLSRGRYSITGDDFVRGSVPTRLRLKQDGLPIDLRDLDLDLNLNRQWAAALPTDSITALRVISQAGLDPASPLQFVLPITRNKGIVYPERITRELLLRYSLPPRFYVAPIHDDKSWRGIWWARRVDLGVLGAGLLVLLVALAGQRRLTANGRHMTWFRRAYLLFTVGFIGYYCQVQLSIVNLTGVGQALLARRSLDYLLYDPPTLLLWSFVLVTLLVWGRGTFCGWLCPFGALQEASGKVGRWLRLPQYKLGSAADARLKWLKYGVLALIAASLLFQVRVTDALVEVEPFKTSITLNFVRAWPFVLYAAGLLLASSMMYKFFCRYLCPLGAALALLGRVRLLRWIPRRAECGTPCQTCRHRCDYQAIKPGGQIVYAECFQCLDCVVIHASDQKCAPLMLELKRSRVIPIVSAEAS